MTIIAYKDGMLAADQAGFSGSTRCSLARKIAKRSDGALIGVAGNGQLASAYLRWFLERDDGSSPALGDREDNAGGIIIHPSGQVEEFDRFGRMEIYGPYFAKGAGADFALAAMEMGADARRAVEVAIKFEGYTGGGIDVLHLGQKPALVRALS